MSGGPHNTPLMRVLANRRMTLTADVYRSPSAVDDKVGVPVLAASDQPIHAYEPSTPAALTLLADLGATRANWIGEMRAGVDITEGDELQIANVVYQVERAVARPDLTFLALWKTKASPYASAAFALLLEDGITALLLEDGITALLLE